MRAISGLVLTAACLGVAVTWVSADTRTLPKTEGWIEARTEHFTLYSNSGDRPTRKTAVELERFRQSLGRMTRGLQLDPRVPTSIVMFRTDAAFTPYKLDDHGRPLNVSGYFVSGPFQNYIAMDSSAWSSPLRTVYHEYVHAVLDATIGRLPMWLNEGLAEYFSTFRMRAGTAMVEIGHPIDEHLIYMAQQTMMRWSDVFDVTQDSPDYNEGARQGAFYAQSWLLVHYFWATGERAKGLDRYLTLLRGGADPEESLKTAFGMDRSGLATAVEAYRHTGSNYVLWDLGVERPGVEVTVREMAPAEVLFRLGDLLARQGQEKDALRHLDAARAAGWPEAPIETALGYAALHRQDTAAARSRLEKAISAEASSVEPFVLLAGLRLDEAARQSQAMASAAAPGVLAARALLQRGLERDADNFYALVGLAQTYLFEGDAAVGVAALEKARKLRPLAPEILRIGVCLLARDGKVAEAWAVVARAIAPKDRELAERSKECVVYGTITAARDRLDAGDRDGARQVLSAAMNTIDEERHRSRIAPVYEVVSAGGQLVVTQSENAMADRYNEAVRLIRSGDYEEALERLQALQKSCTGEEVCKVISETAGKLAGTVAANKLIERFNEAVRLANAGEKKRALELLETLEKEVTDPKLLAAVRDLMEGLGKRNRK